MSLVTESGREQLETARSAPDPEPIGANTQNWAGGVQKALNNADLCMKN